MSCSPGSDRPRRLRMVALSAAVLLLAGACGTSSGASDQPDTAAPGAPDSSPAPDPGSGSAGADSMDEIPLADAAVIRTNMGKIKVEFFPDEAPTTVRNFVGLATGKTPWIDPKTGELNSDPLYNGVIFHRVLPGFMIQGGDPLGTGTGGPGYQFDDEINEGRTFDKPYRLAMANSGPDTNGSQFFITVAATDWLNYKHTIFGEVTDKGSQEVVDKIAAVPTDARDRPEQDVVIKTIEIQEKLEEN